MISFSVEKFTDIEKEIVPLWVEHYNEIDNHKDIFPIDPDLQFYKEMCEKNLFFIFCARKENKLIGYLTGFLMNNIQSKNCVRFTTEATYIKKNERYANLGAKLIKFSKEKIKEMGVNEWVIGMKNNYDISKFLEKNNFEKYEIYYSMVL